MAAKEDILVRIQTGGMDPRGANQGKAEAHRGREGRALSDLLLKAAVWGRKATSKDN